MSAGQGDVSLVAGWHIDFRLNYDTIPLSSHSLVAPDDRLQFARVMMTRLMTRQTHPLSTIIKVRQGRAAGRHHVHALTDLEQNAFTIPSQVFNRQGEIKLVGPQG